MSETTGKLAELVGGKLNGDNKVEIHRVASLEDAQDGEISFIEKVEFDAPTKQSNASCLIVPENFETQLPCPFIQVKNPKLAFAKIAKVLHPYIGRSVWHEMVIVPESSEVRASFIGAFVTLGENTYIGEYTEIFDGVRIGNSVKIGKYSLIHPNCVIYDNVSIGSNCEIHAGTIIGADGFGFVRDENGYVKFPQIGMVVIEDDVEIGANSCVDRGALGETRIGKGTKIDNLVQIAHNVQIGERVVIAAQTGISGSTIIESDCIIGGQVGMGDHARIQSGAIIGSQAGVLPNKIVRAGVWWGTPVQPLDEYKRQNAHVKSLSRLKEEVKDLKKQIDALKNEKQTD
ncbi:MAG: UDP-3-O-(3-hydroxymyristoyl)glucosamine N-acyltransferase [Acidobacteria bacterium]|nr:UDP-3-O-(3-hydroxymyristoyl)glucosamine N-acyltransferase [Acidobacteriota bacterium]MCA1637040.1 UDP-3-O-(3-hydroxymyristoyl)glucosamine N-acyltransferase [Acidobacteriota bacterium]